MYKENPTQNPRNILLGVWESTFLAQGFDSISFQLGIFFPGSQISTPNPFKPVPNESKFHSCCSHSQIPVGITFLGRGCLGILILFPYLCHFLPVVKEFPAVLIMQKPGKEGKKRGIIIQILIFWDGNSSNSHMEKWRNYSKCT